MPAAGVVVLAFEGAAVEDPPPASGPVGELVALVEKPLGIDGGAKRPLDANRRSPLVLLVWGVHEPLRAPKIPTSLRSDYFVRRQPTPDFTPHEDENFTVGKTQVSGKLPSRPPLGEDG